MTSFTSKVSPATLRAVPVKRPGMSSLGPNVGVRVAATLWPATVAAHRVIIQFGRVIVNRAGNCITGAGRDRK